MIFLLNSLPFWILFLWKFTIWKSPIIKAQLYKKSNCNSLDEGCSFVCCVQFFGHKTITKTRLKARIYALLRDLLWFESLLLRHFYSNSQISKVLEIWEFSYFCPKFRFFWHSGAEIGGIFCLLFVSISDYIS